jgi:hypothetical protein
MFKKYWKVIREEAWAETVKSLHLNSLAGFAMWLLGSAAALVGLFFWGSQDGPNDEFIARIFAAFVVVGAIPFVFAWKFVGMPPRIHQNLRDWTKELETAIIEAQATDGVVYGLGERYNEGLRVFGNGGDIKAWEADFDAYVKQHFEAGFFLQLCGAPPPVGGFTTIQRGGGPVKKFKHPPPDERERIETKLQKIAGQLPYCATYYRGRTINTLNFTYTSIRQFGLREHRSPTGTEAEMLR